MVGTPGLFAAFGNGEAFGQCVQSLEAEFAGNVTFVLCQNLLAELLFEVAADNPYDLAETGLDGIIDAVVHNALTLRAESVQLLQTTVAATHTGSQKE